MTPSTTLRDLISTNSSTEDLIFYLMCIKAADNFENSSAEVPCIHTTDSYEKCVDAHHCPLGYHNFDNAYLGELLIKMLHSSEIGLTTYDWMIRHGMMDRIIQRAEQMDSREPRCPQASARRARRD